VLSFFTDFGNKSNLVIFKLFLQLLFPILVLLAKLLFKGLTEYLLLILPISNDISTALKDFIYSTS